MIKRIANNQLYHLVLANIRELIREPGVLFWGIVFPILMSLGLGVAFTKKKETRTTVAVIGEQTLAVRPGDSASLLRTFLLGRHAAGGRDRDGRLTRTLTVPDEKLGNTTWVFRSLPWEEATALLKRGSLSIVLEDNGKEIRYHFDPLNPDAQLTYLKLTNLIGAAGTEHPSVVPLTVTGSRYIDFLVPGLIAMGVMMSCMWGVSYAIIERRSKKLLRRMVATPMRRSNFLIALMTVRVLMNFVEAGLLMLFAWLVFGITIQGSVAALLAIFVAGNFAFTGIAVLMASRTAKTEIGNGLINAVSMPMMVLSGIFFSYHNFPEWSIPVIRAFPLTMLADGMRGIMIEGAGVAQVALPVLVLGTIGFVFFTAGMKLFRWH